MKDDKKLQYSDYLDGTYKILDESQKEKKPYMFKVASHDYIVFPNVFSPKYFNDTEKFAEHLQVNTGDDILEIGPGTGVVSINAIYKGANKVVAIEINPVAVKNTQANIDLHKMEGKVEVRKGDVYSSLKIGEKFDMIFWNTPFGLVPEDEKVSDIKISVVDPGYKATERFIKDAHKYLKDGGRVIIGFSTTLGKFNKLKQFCKEADLELSLMYEEDSTEVHRVKFEMFQAVPKA